MIYNEFWSFIRFKILKPHNFSKNVILHKLQPIDTLRFSLNIKVPWICKDQLLDPKHMNKGRSTLGSLGYSSWDREEDETAEKNEDWISDVIEKTWNSDVGRARLKEKGEDGLKNMVKVERERERKRVMERGEGDPKGVGSRKREWERRGLFMERGDKAQC